MRTGLAMRDDFCVFILTHGRPDRVLTYNSIRRAGYTGKVYLVIDDEDASADAYRAKYGDSVLQIRKSEIADRIDEGDNFEDRRAIIYARNACWDLARQVGCKYFIQFDDDYSAFFHRFDEAGEAASITLRSLDAVLSAFLAFFESVPGLLTVAMAQGGDFIGGGAGQDRPATRRKAMNSFICSVDRPFEFAGRMNEDVNTYTSFGHRGGLFLTVLHAQLVQAQTQQSAGGMTDIYQLNGTYVKSFYSVMYSPSFVQIGVIGDPRSPNFRIHHKINWHRGVPVILSEQHRKTRGAE